jgi:hypothetical protein
MRTPSRWDLLLDTKPVSLLRHLLDQVPGLLAKDLSQWPLPIQELDPETGRRYAPLLDPASVRPGKEVFAEAFRLARWELERDVEAVDDYMRNQRWAAHGLTAEAKLALLFISRWLVEQLLSLREATHGKVTRVQLVECLDALRLAARPGADA